MGKWTRRDLVKTGLAASAGVLANKELRAESAESKQAAAASASTFAQLDLAAPNPFRERLLLDYGWRFALGNADDPDKDFGFGKLSAGSGTYAKAGRAGGPTAPRFDDSAWQKIDLPHDWAVDLPFVNNPLLIDHGAKPLGREYPETSIGWYRREFVLPGSDAGRRICVEFDGIFRNATVFFNGHYITENMSGYAPLNLDLTDFVNLADKAAVDRAAEDEARIAAAGADAAAVARIRAGMQKPGSNVLVVRVDATLDEGWFYEGAGIYRHAWLTKTAPVHIARWGNYVRTESGAPNHPATISLSSEVANESDAAVTARVHAAFVDAAGKTVANAVSEPASIAAGEGHDFALRATVAAAKLWSCEEPNLYRAVTSLEVTGKLTDRDETSFGIRTVKFDVDKGFFLNGKPVKIKGTCNHQDHAGVGAAIPDRIQAYRLERLKWMGSNGCRTSHNPPTPEFLDACDRMGMLVMDETRMMSSNPEGLSELERLIKRDRNHPSVVIWSLGNEEAEQGSARGAKIVATMKKLQRRLDPTRLSTAAMSGGWGGVGISNVLDVHGMQLQRRPDRQVPQGLSQAADDRDRDGKHSGDARHLRERQGARLHERVRHGEAGVGQHGGGVVDVLRCARVAGGRVCVDRLRLPRRDDAVQVAVYQLALWDSGHMRLRQRHGVLLQDVVGRGASAPSAAALELGGQRGPGD